MKRKRARTLIAFTILVAASGGCDQSPTGSVEPSPAEELDVRVDAEGRLVGPTSEPSREVRWEVRHQTSALTGSPGVVVPAAFEAVFASGENTFPHGWFDMRYQQVFVGTELGGPQTFRELCLRPAEELAEQEPLVRPLTIKLGSTDRTPANIGPDFDANYSSPPTTVFSDEFEMPATDRGQLDDWIACAEFSTPFDYTGGNLLVEMINPAAEEPGVWFADWCERETGCTTTRLFALDASATTAETVRRDQGLVMRLSPGEVGTIRVDVDIKPNSDENPVSLRGKGLLPVAILTTDDFDAAEVDPSTVTLGDDDGDDTPVPEKPNGSLFATFEDVDGDADVDLLLHFEVEALVESGDLDSSTTELTLNGETSDGTPIRGTDIVRRVGR